MGNPFGVKTRVSVWFALIAVILCSNFGMQIGAILTLMLFVSTLFHEFAHVFAARKTGGAADEILIWPLGGLAFTKPAANFYSEVWTSLAGPISNGVICLACLPALIASGTVKEGMSLLFMPDVDLGPNVLTDVCLLLFSLNFKLMVVNLLPIYPLDGGQIVLTWAKVYWDRHTARMGTMLVGLAGCVLLLLATYYVKSLDLMLLTSVLLAMCQFEYLVSVLGRAHDESFLGYDFSQGYTSLEDGDDRESAPKVGLLERWRRQKAEQKREKDQLLRLESERRLDELLEKINQQGMKSLTSDEQRFLREASGRYRSHGNG
ncbi:M50 family metallopeptidase [Planctomicrobium sp. SH668]|uniref:M50 family metallopeptidase n=1 Tax=Planctomicrobium sp. SH668 TaxID=3448126 RepID=UPI003F5B994C